MAKVDNIDTTDFVLKLSMTLTKKKIPDVTDFVKKGKFNELENKIPDISNLATKLQ